MLVDIEAIKQLKHAYFRRIDTANLEELAELFHEDVSVHFIGGTEAPGPRGILEAISKSFTTGAVGHHNGHHPEIQILSETEATGIWYLADNMWILSADFYTTGTALYWDRYLKVGGRWTIKDTKYRRLYETNRVLDENPPRAAHYRGAHRNPPDLEPTP